MRGRGAGRRGQRGGRGRSSGGAGGARFALLAFVLWAAPAGARNVLFVGNSFTEGWTSPVRPWHRDRVRDLNRTQVGGVPALFQAFAEQLRLDWTVSLETAGGRTLGWHLAERRPLLDRRWDAVVLQEYSTLDPLRPGDPAAYWRDAAALAALFRARNPAVAIGLTATWSRADLTYRAPGGRWHGRPVQAMADEVEVAVRGARRRIGGTARLLPVGRAWNLAFAAGVADPNPYDGVAYGRLDLWGYDQYHAGTAGYYLEALVVLAGVAGADPRALGPAERAAGELGLSPAQAVALQRLAWDAWVASRMGVE